MTDTDKLKRLACWLDVHGRRHNPWQDKYSDASKAILALIAENERLKVREMNLEEVGREQAVRVMREATRAKATKDERDEAVALLREFMNEGDTSSVYNDVRSFLARIDRDEEYNAIVAGLKDAIDMSENT